MNRKVFKLCDKVDRLKSAMAKKHVNHRKRYKLKRAEMKARKRIKNMVGDRHRKAVKWLCSNYQVILLPKYEISNMVKKEDRNIGKKTAHSMYTWCHYRFKQR
jgi:putative transposase